MKAKREIEEILKEKFDSFEPHVPDAIWANVQSSIGSGATSGGILSTVVGKVAAVIVGGGILVGSIYTINNQLTKEIDEDRIESSYQPSEPTGTTSDITSPENKTAPLTESKIVLVEVSENWEKTETPVRVRVKTITKTDKDRKEPVYESVADMHLSQSSRTVITLQDLENMTQDPAKTESQITEDMTIVVEKPEEDGKLFATINASVVGGVAPLSVDFTQYSSEGKIKWVFGDNATSFKESPSHTYTEAGRYVVSLIIESPTGEYIIDEKVIEVAESVEDENADPLPVSQINSKPNVFTPNGDGINDYMFVGAENMELFHFFLMDVNTSKIVFESHNPAFRWDGTLKNGNRIANGTYIYVIRAKGKDSKVYDSSGQLSVQ